MTEDPQEFASLIAGLNGLDKKAIRRAADSLIAMGQQRPQLAQRLNQLLSETSQQNRWPFAYVLARLRKPSALCVSVLVENLGNPDSDIRWAALRLLVDLRKIIPDIDVPVLTALKTGGPVQRRMALYCLRDLELKDSASLKALANALRDSDPLVRVAALTGVKSRTDLGREEVDLLLHLFLEDSDSRVRHNAAVALAQTAAVNFEIKAALEQATQTDNVQLKKAASKALALMKKRAHPNRRQCGWTGSR